MTNIGLNIPSDMLCVQHEVSSGLTQESIFHKDCTSQRIAARNSGSFPS
jgi:hypothetical protein